jgi:16S rRNA (cytosine967-C5)-methyltransferase
MHARLLNLTAELLAKMNREHPADAVLRTELKSRHIPRSDAGAVSRAVFAFHRWCGWADSSAPLETQLAFALECAARYARDPNSFADEELLARAVPAWTRTHVAVTPAWIRAIQSEPALWLRARPGAAERLIELLGDARPGPLPDSVRYEGREDLFRTEMFHAGEFEVQDIASQAVGLMCDPQPGETWWDACAGEGGKTLHFSDLMQNSGLIWSSDRADWRLKRLKLRAARAKAFNYRAAAWDGGPHLPTKTMFDGVLVDAPCSGVGTWQRNPHSRWTTTENDVRELAAVQSRLLDHAAKSVKPGGRLLYAVCTLTDAETTAVAREFERTHPAFRALGRKNPLCPDDSARVQTWLWPQTFGGNGMFVAAWEKA